MSFQPISAIPPLIPGDANYESLYTQNLVTFNTIEVNTIVTQVITGLLPPTQGSEATNKDYVDGITNSLVWKNPVRLSTTTEDLVLYGTGQFIDGVMTLVGDRILVKNQTTSSENGIYTVSSSSWLRASDASIGLPATGVYVYVISGASNQTKLFVCQTPSSLFGDSITFTLFSSGGSGSPGGPPNGSVQFNNSGSFDGTSNFQWSSGILTVTGAINSTSLSSSTLNVAGDSKLQDTTIANLNVSGSINFQALVVNSITTSGLEVTGSSIFTNSTMTGTLNVNDITTSQLSVSGSSYLQNIIGTSGSISNLNSVYLSSSNLIATTGTISSLSSTDLTTANLVATSGTITSLALTDINVTNISTGTLNVSSDSIVQGISSTSLYVSGQSTFQNIVANDITTSGLSVTNLTNLNNLTSNSITSSNLVISTTGSVILGTSASIILDGTSNRILGLPSVPIYESEAVNKAYVDAQIGSDPGGTEGSIQYNSGNLFTGDTNFKWSGSGLTVLGTTDTDGKFTSTCSIDSISSITGAMVLSGGLGVAGNIHVASNVYADGFFSTSDVMCKTDIHPLYNSTDIINKIECCSYKLKGCDELNYGVLAQQLDNIGLSNLVNKTDKYKSVNYTQLIALIINSIQEIHSELELMKKIQSLNY